VRCRIGFVTQDDVLFPQLTVEETLVFAAFLRLPACMSKQQKRDRVDAIIAELNLERLPFIPFLVFIGEFEFSPVCKCKHACIHVVWIII
jgi:hypothetical protein